MSQLIHPLHVVVLVLVVAVVATGCRSGSAERPSARGAETDPPVRVADNEELRAMYEADQGDRQEDQQATLIWDSVAARDMQRRTRVDEMLAAGEVRTGNDYFHAAMIFQHGLEPQDYEKAHGLARRAVELGCENSAARWLTAATWDRYQMSRGQPQWYGTQYIKRGADAPFELYEVDESAVTDEDRRTLGVPPLAEARARAERMNAE